MYLPQVISAKSIKEARYRAVNHIMNNGRILKDQRGELTKEVLNLIITIPSTKAELSDDPITARLQTDFALGLIKHDIAKERGNAFEYAYGWELRDNAGLKRTIEILREEPETRRAYIPMFKTKHIGETDIPCFIGLDFIIREDELFLTAFARSNENAIAMQSDIYGFTQLQKYIASELELYSGNYCQHVVSAHVRLNSEGDLIKKILKEGY